MTSSEDERDGFLDLFEMYKRLGDFCMVYDEELNPDQEVLFTNILLEWNSKAFADLRKKILEPVRKRIADDLSECFGAG